MPTEEASEKSAEREAQAFWGCGREFALSLKIFKCLEARGFCILESVASEGTRLKTGVDSFRGLGCSSTGHAQNFAKP